MYGFDLFGWLRGDVRASNNQVIALLNGLPADTPFQAHLKATLENHPHPPDERTPAQKKFDERVAELELFGWENKLRALAVNAAAHQNVIKLPGDKPSPEHGVKPSSAKSLFAQLGGDPSLLGKKKDND